MNIKGFRIKNQKIQKIWIAVASALMVAALLIIISFFLVFRKSGMTNLGKEDLFDFLSYYTKYNVVTYSNKNQNTYMMEEYCMKNDNDVKFRFNTLNKDNNYSYIVTNNTFHIKSENQISEFKNNVNISSNTNLLSLATFIELYSKIDKMLEENTFSNNGVEILAQEKDNNISYTIMFKEGNKSIDEISVYKEAMINGMKVSKLELILDTKTLKPIEYIVYLENGNAYVDITYEQFEINTKFDEKVFSF